jgi:[ribosomal protein S5]-alanine N-acetyltransferase
MHRSLLPDLSTRRLTLRPLVPGDVQALFALRSNETVNRYLDRQRPSDTNETLQFIGTITEGIESNNWTYWCITLEKALVGTICLWNFSSDKRTAELGYELHPDFQGQGIMGEAIQKVLAFGFGVLGLDCVEAYVHPENKRSIRLLLEHRFEMDPLKNPNEELKFVLRNLRPS